MCLSSGTCIYKFHLKDPKKKLTNKEKIEKSKIGRYENSDRPSKSFFRDRVEKDERSLRMEKDFFDCWI
jgi:hypothetical protein